MDRIRFREISQRMAREVMHPEEFDREVVCANAIFDRAELLDAAANLDAELHQTKMKLSEVQQQQFRLQGVCEMLRAQLMHAGIQPAY